MGVVYKFAFGAVSFFIQLPLATQIKFLNVPSSNSSRRNILSVLLQGSNLKKINMQAVHVFCSVQPTVLAASSINEKSSNLTAVSLLFKSVA